MTLEQFVKNNWKMIDEVIMSQCPEQWEDAPIDNEERELWVLNDEGLYGTAIREGVDLDE